MANQKEIIAQKWLGTNLVMLHYIGLWPADDSNVFYYIYGLFILSFAINHMVSASIMLYNAWNNTNAFLSIVSLLLVFSETIIRNVVIIIEREHFENLCMQLDANYSIMEKKQTMSKVISKRIERLSLMFMFGCIGVSFVWHIEPIYQVILLWTTADFDQNYKRVLAFDLYFPFDWRLSPMFECVVLYELIELFLLSCMYSTVTCILVTFMGHISGQLLSLADILNSLNTDNTKDLLLSPKGNKSMQRIYLSKTKTNAKLNKDTPPNIIEYAYESITVNKPQMEINPIHNPIRIDDSTHLNFVANEIITTHSLLEESHFKDDMNGAILSLGGKNKEVVFSKHSQLDNKVINAGIECHLNQCIEYHKLIISFAERFEKLTSKILFFQYIVLTILICFTTYQTVNNFNSVTNFLKFSTFAIVMVIELFMYCSHGEAIITSSLKLNEAIYNLGWFDQSENFKTTTMIMLMRSQKHIALRAGPFYVISLATFRHVMDTSYKYFTLLIQLNK